MSGPIILIGFKGSGKSAIGKALASKLNLPFTDTDDIIEKLYNEREGEALAFRQIYKKHGGEYFKELEAQAVKKALSAADRVVSFGGGTLMNVDKAGFEPKGAMLVHIKVEKDTLFKRIMKGGTPAFFDGADPRGSFEKLLAEREPVYGKYADITVDNTDRTVEEVADEIAGQVKDN